MTRAGSGAPGRRRVIVSADDFGLSEAVNEGIERAHREGCLTTTSLMVAGPAAADAVTRARRNPNLRVGLHLVVIEGPSVMPHTAIPHLVDPDGQFGSDQLRLGLRYRFSRAARRELALEIEAQFDAFRATGLLLDHATAHKHMHLHPSVGALLVRTGARHNLRAVRVPSEPAPPLRACGTPATAPAAMLRSWTQLLRAQVRRAGMVTTDHCFGLAWTGRMTADRVSRLLDQLPAGTSELYFHPATRRDATLARLMPGYDHAGELAALVEPGIAGRLRAIATDWASLPA